MTDNHSKNPMGSIPPSTGWEDYIRPILGRIGKLSSTKAKDDAKEAFFSSFDKNAKIKVKDIYEDSYDYEKQITRAFLSVADAIRDETFFWELAGQFWIKGGQKTDLWDPFFDKPAFKKVPVIKRIKLWNDDCAIKGYPETIYQDWREDRPILAYRTFRAKSGKQIRRSNDKQDIEFFEQVEGQGYSYSLSRIVAINFSSIGINEQIIAKYFSDPVSLELARQFPIDPSGSTYARDNQLGDRAYLGTFHLRKSDVVSLAFARNEEEVVSVRSRLIHYRPITLNDFLSARALTANIRDLEVSENCYVARHRMAEQKLLREAGKFINRLDHRWKFLIARGKDHPFKNNVSADDNKGVNSLFFNSEKKVLRLPRQGVYAGRSRYADYPEIVTFVPKKDQGNLLHLFD